ncbi:MAG TPA: hypothetical protein VHC69_25490 [Polyangiaceae bacterium]|nr:hypothetical protein [Polyangiaceae bacterium]
MSDSRKVWTWWTCLRLIAVFNVVVWAVTCLPFVEAESVLGWQVTLSGIFVAVCAFRSWLPRVDLERYCLVDSPLSSMFVGRSAATIAEIAFAVQIAMCLRQIGVIAHLPWIVTASHLVVPPLVLAQCFCWYSVLTLNHLGHAIEESLWTATMALVGVCLAVAARHLQGSVFWCACGGALLAVGFVAFMTLVDVPMYVSRWRQAHRERRPFLSVREGVQDALNRRIATDEWAVWRPEVAWLTGYFSIAVWLSVSLVHFARP